MKIIMNSIRFVYMLLTFVIGTLLFFGELFLLLIGPSPSTFDINSLAIGIGLLILFFIPILLTYEDN